MAVAVHDCVVDDEPCSPISETLRYVIELVYVDRITVNFGAVSTVHLQIPSNINQGCADDDTSADGTASFLSVLRQTRTQTYA